MSGLFGCFHIPVHFKPLGVSQFEILEFKEETKIGEKKI